MGLDGIIGTLRASRARVVARYFIVCALSALSPKVSRFGLVQTMLRILFAPAVLCTVASLVPRIVINFSILASLSTPSVWAYVSEADGTRA